MNDPLPPDVPARVGDYRVLSLIGLGGMAEVFLAEADGESAVAPRVVLKRIRRMLSSHERVRLMFLREARQAARLHHDNVVTVYGLIEEGDEPWIVMEHLEGLSWRDVARRCWGARKPLALSAVLRGAADAALGLQHAHDLRGERGAKTPLVHRDISPDNLFLVQDGRTKVLDFGIAKAADAENLTRTAELKGKIPYMSPEQVRGDEITPASDLWALGVTLYWLLTGSRPFHAKTDALLGWAILRDPPRPLSELNPHLPRTLVALVDGLLAKDPRDRPSTAGEVAKQLLALSPPDERARDALWLISEAMTLSHVEEGRELSGFRPACLPAVGADEPTLKRSVTDVVRAYAASSALPTVNEQRAVSATPVSVTPDGVTLVAKALVGSRPSTVTSEDEATEQGVPIPASLVDEPVLEPTLQVQYESLRPEVPQRPPVTLELPAVAESKPARAPRWRSWLGAAALLFGGVAIGAVLFAAPTAKRDAEDERSVIVAVPAKDSVGGVRTAPPTAPSREDPPAPGSDIEPLPVDDEAPSKAASPDAPVQPSQPQEADASPKSAPDAARDDIEEPDAQPSTKRRSAQRRAATTRTVAVSAPGAARWYVPGSTRSLKVKDGAVVIPRGVTELDAVDAETGGRTRVAVQDNRADLGAVPTGKLDIAALPWAEVRLGRKVLGNTPLAPLSVRAGRYDITLRWEGRERTVSAVVEPGRTARVREDLRR